MRFVEETGERGIGFIHDNGASDDFYFVELFGSGAIFFDADGDGDPDLFLPNQTTISRPHPEPAPHSAFYLNDGRGEFTDITAGSGLLDGSFQVGVCGGDIDNDGDTDLYVTRFDGPNALYRNNGDLTFTEIAAEAGVRGGPDTDASCAFGDVDGDGLLDLFVAGYCNNSRSYNPVCGLPRKPDRKPVRAYCNVNKLSGIHDILYHNLGGGKFEDVTTRSGLGEATGRSLGVAFTDVDLDGDVDLYVACDRTASLLYENLGKGTFVERAGRSGVAFSMDGLAEAGMGTAWGDFNDDGLPDLLKTNFEFEPNNLYVNTGNLSFTDRAADLGFGEPSISYLSWGVDFFDADNDGDLDVFVANGHVRDKSLYAGMGDTGAGFAQVNQFFEQVVPGRFVSRRNEAGPAMDVARISRGVAWADIDADGDVDFIVTNLQDRPTLYVNETPPYGHWLEVRLSGTRSNRSAIGARVTARLADRTLTREVRSGQSYLSQSDLTLHFGLGGETSVGLLTVYWPSGLVETFEHVGADRVIRLVEGVSGVPGGSGA